MAKTLGLATRTFPCFPQSNCIYKQQINKLHRSLFNFLPQRRRKLSTCPHVLNFLARALSFLLPKFDKCFLCTCEWKSIGFHSNSFPKIQACFLQNNFIFHHSLKKTIRIAAIPRSLCLSLSPAVSKNHWQSIRSQKSNRGCIARRRIQKEEEDHASN